MQKIKKGKFKFLWFLLFLTVKHVRTISDSSSTSKTVSRVVFFSFFFFVLKCSKVYDGDILCVALDLHKFKVLGNLMIAVLNDS